MSITRKSLAATIDEYDSEIETLNDGKRDTFIAYRAQLAAAGMDKDQIKDEIAAFKLALKRRRAVKEDPQGVEAKDNLVDEIFAEIGGLSRAAHVRVENVEEFQTHIAGFEAGKNSIRDSEASPPAEEGSQLAPNGDAPEASPENASEEPPLDAADLPEGANASGLYSNREEAAPSAPATAEEASPVQAVQQASSASHSDETHEHTYIPLDPAEIELPVFLDRRRMQVPDRQVSENT